MQLLLSECRNSLRNYAGFAVLDSFLFKPIALELG